MTEKNSDASAENRYLVPASIVVAALILAGAWVYTVGVKAGAQQKGDIASGEEQAPVSALEEKVLPSEGVELPVVWGDLGAKLVGAGVIDADKFKAIYDARGAFTKADEKLLFAKNNGRLVMNSDNAGYLLNLLWALGLGSKNPVLDTGEMMNPAYGGAGNFASTGGWTIAEGDAMDHYSRHEFFTLTSEQQELVERVSKGIYRPCCGNSTHFPDCNHGMAMLGLLELMASQGVSEASMWKTALAVNAYWFPNNYLTIATYMKDKGVDWNSVNPKEMLGKNYSSSAGYANISAQVAEPQQQSGGGSGCGVDAGTKPAAPQQQQPRRQQGGCGI